MGLQIAQAKIEGFGRLVQRVYALARGLSLLLGKNEMGKSTWVAFVKAVLFGLEPREAEPFRPWQPGAPFAGELTVVRPGARITIRREFETNEVTWKEVDPVSGTVKDEFSDTVAPRARRVAREEYDRRLVSLLGFASQGIFSSCVMAEQGGLREMNAAELGPELRARLTGGEGTDYEDALKELSERFKHITNEELRKGAKDGLLETKRNEREQKQEELQHALAEWAHAGECQARLEKAKQRAESWKEKVSSGAVLIKALDELDRVNERICELEKQHDLLAGQLRQIEETEKQLAAAEVELSRYEAEARAPRNASEKLAEVQRGQTALKAAQEKALMLEKQQKSHRPARLLVAGVGGFLLVALAFLVGGWKAALVAAVVVILGVGLWCAMEWMDRREQRRRVEGAVAEERQLAEKLAQIEGEMRKIWPDFDAGRTQKFAQRLLDYERAKACRDAVQATLVNLEKKKEYLRNKEMLERELAVTKQQREMIFRKSPPLRTMDAAEQMRLRPQQETLERELAAAQNDIRKSELELAASRASESSPQQLEEEIRLLAEEEARLAYQRDVLRVARAVLAESIEEYRTNYAPQLEQKVNEAFCTITGEKARRVILDDKLAPTIRWVDGVERDVRVLSAGGLDQLYFSMRLAAMSLLSRGQGAAELELPLILDDPFSSFDDDRCAQAMDMLRSLSQRHQIILLTHDERARKYADAVVDL